MDDPARSLASATEDDEDSGGEWLVTFSDLVTLLLTFFVFLVAMANLDEQKFEQIVESIQANLGKQESPGGDVGRLNLTRTQPRSLDQLTGLEEEPLLEDVQQTLKMKNIDDFVRVTTTGNEVVMRVEGQTFFTSGQAELKKEALPILDQVAAIVLRHADYVLHIKGHSDPRPISSAKFDSNWELSALRATAVLRYLLGKGVPARRMTATGYADTQPLLPNTSEENMAKNRRVEFVLEKKESHPGR